MDLDLATRGSWSVSDGRLTLASVRSAMRRSSARACSLCSDLTRPSAARNQREGIARTERIEDELDALQAAADDLDADVARGSQRAAIFRYFVFDAPVLLPRWTRGRAGRCRGQSRPVLLPGLRHAHALPQQHGKALHAWHETPHSGVGFLYTVESHKSLALE